MTMLVGVRSTAAEAGGRADSDKATTRAVSADGRNARQ